MKVTIQFPDSLGEAYTNAAPEGKKLEEVLVDQLVKFAAARPDEKFIILSASDRERLDKALNCVPLASAHQLVNAVEAFAEINVGGIRLHWTAAQRRELEHKADRMGMKVEYYLEAVVRRVLEDHILDASPRVGEMLEIPAVAKKPEAVAAAAGGKR